MTEPRDEPSQGGETTPQEPKAQSDSAGGSGATDVPGEGDSGAAGRASATASAWLTQLQTMIDNVSTQATPVLRDVAAKAAELAAKAGEAAGPLAYRAASTTERIGQRVAERGREVAADLRRAAGGDAAAGTPDEAPGGADEGGPSPEEGAAGLEKPTG